MVRKKYWIIRSDDHDDSDEHVYDRITISVAEKLLSMWVINTWISSVFHIIEWVEYPD